MGKGPQARHHSIMLIRKKPGLRGLSFEIHFQQDAEKVRRQRSRLVQTLNVPQRVRLGPSLTAALLDGIFEHPVIVPHMQTIEVLTYPNSFPAVC